jgi:nucleoside-diphosphate-sugar epimerase
MRVFIAGASGAIGRPLVERLVAAGHEVTGTTRTPEKAELLRAAGAEPVVLDAFDTAALRDAVVAARPDVVMNQLTSLSEPMNPRRYGRWLETTNRLRAEVTPVLVDAAREAGARRVVAQSVSFLTAPEGPPVVDETARLWLDVPDDARSGVEALRTMEEAVVGAGGIVLRYGFFYGPGTSYARDGQVAGEIRRRRLPVVGGGGGLASFIHVEDAADATVRALDHGEPGIYNVVDDTPVAQAEWVPELARLLEAKRPRRVPAWLARLATSPQVAAFATQARGSSNAKARAQLGWQPAHPDWRAGFAEVFGRH